jgi:hypothetical protein
MIDSEEILATVSSDLNWHSLGRPMTSTRLVAIVDFIVKWIDDNSDPTTDKPDYKVWCLINNETYRKPFHQELRSRLKNSSNIYFGKPLLVNELFSGNKWATLLYVADCHYGDGTRAIIEVMKRWGTEIVYESHS